MEVEEQKSQEGKPGINQPPVSQTVSGPQAVEGSRNPISPSSGPHKEEVLQKRFHNRVDRREVHFHEDRKRQAAQQEVRVSQVRGPTLKEAAQQVRREEEERMQEVVCPKAMQVENPPFPEAPASTAANTNEATGDTQEMEQ